VNITKSNGTQGPGGDFGAYLVYLSD
jgi:hypothetical protein